MRGVRILALSGVIAIGAALVACGTAPSHPATAVTEVDRTRAAVLSNDPVLKTAVAPPQVTPGHIISAKLGWDRTEVRARLYAHKPATTGAGPTAGAVEKELATRITALRTEGWNVYWALCLPPNPQAVAGQPMATPEPMPENVVRSEGYQWVVYAYKISSGVSYWSMLTAERLEGGDAWIDIVLRAPTSAEPSNLFVDRPKTLAAGK